MPPPGTTTTETLRRQVRRCRWRRNLVTAQVVVFGTAAAMLACATALLVAALVATPRVFGAVLVVAALALVAAEALLLRHARRGWVRWGAAAAWIDDVAGLGGRLTTVVALGDRAALLVPLLREQNERRRAAWMPDRLVPTPFPPLALGAVLAASTAFLVALSWAPSLEPPRGVALGAAAAEGGAGDEGGLDGWARRLLASVSPRAPGGGEASADPSGASDVDGGGERGGVGRVPASLQASIRRRLWGERWAPPEPAVAARSADAARAGDARRDRAATLARRSGIATGGEGPSAVEPSNDGATASTEEGGGGGAGTGTDPELFGEVAADDDAAGGRFALGLAARVLGTRTGPRRPSGPPAPSEEDEHPLLAARPRPDEPFHTAVVPPAYGPIVRAVFAHGALAGGAP